MRCVIIVFCIVRIVVDMGFVLMGYIIICVYVIGVIMEVNVKYLNLI